MASKQAFSHSSSEGPLEELLWETFLEHLPGIFVGPIIHNTFKHVFKKLRLISKLN